MDNNVTVYALRIVRFTTRQARDFQVELYHAALHKNASYLTVTKIEVLLPLCNRFRGEQLSIHF